MAVVSLATTVTGAANALYEEGVAGVAILAGEVVYKNLTTGRYELADANVSAAAAVVKGIAMNSAPAAGQPVRVLYDGDVENCGAVLLTGQFYLLSNVAGDLCTATADLTEDTSYVTFVGIGLSTTSLRVKVCVGGVVMNLA